MTARIRKAKAAVLPLPQAGEGWGGALEVRDGSAAPYLAKPQLPRHSRESGNPVSFRNASLGEFIRPRREKSHPSAFPDLPYIGMEHIESHSMRLLGTVPAATMKSTANRFYAGDVLYGRLRPYLNKVYRADFDGLCSAEFIVLPKTTGIEPDFLRYRLNSHDFVRFATHLNAGDRPRIDFDQMSPFKIEVPEPADQRRIVAELETQLTRLDASVTALKRAQANLKRYRASVLKAACEGRLVPTEAELARRDGRSYESGNSLLERVRGARCEAASRTRKGTSGQELNTDGLPPLPEGWAWARLDVLADLKGGITVDKKRRDETARMVPYLRVANVQRG
jgi:type I restriction enzyme, S subunit